MNWKYNSKADDNKNTIDILINQEGYIDLGWANNGKSFSHRNNTTRELDCSAYQSRGSHIVYIDDVNKEILHVDMSD